ncbi:MAG TPA: DUF1223 domain-containing protein [Denitromonas sp.]|uniref:DUF1223 domain-containing protein n=1 Tax=Denitromonas sp. TaxID=2734609 RepID=UPI001D1EBBA0|nr:DUF1223 domain-containing protein [Rhodocyclaceae bacterium]MCP5220938.1 DUF1223 domain-containing protein [Zoogloeaceae bacterium]HQV14658.1 DUF1223 domain-containing protein [Denitromonas sp.]
MPAKPLLALAAALCAGGVTAAECTASSGPLQTPLVELYTSEGCSSCPPADRWLGTLKQSSDTVAIAYHVDYWDYIGWKDRFAEPRNGQRQRNKVALTGGRTVYTPQIMINGRDSRAWRGNDPLAGVTREAAKAHIQLTAIKTPTGATVSVRATAPSDRQTQLVVTRYENGHRSEVKAGENRGETLSHSFVVRDWETRAMPSNAPLNADVRFLPQEKSGGVVAFIEDLRSGEVLQALALPDCHS